MTILNTNNNENHESNASLRVFLLQSLCGFFPIVAVWGYGFEQGFFDGMSMISNGHAWGYFIVLGVILSAVGIWGLFKLQLKLVFPDAYEDSISFYRFHLLCGCVGGLLCVIFFVYHQVLLALLFPPAVIVAYWLYRKCLRLEQLNVL